MADETKVTEKTELHPSNPNHPDYDPLRDPVVKSRIKEMENSVGKLARTHEAEMKTMKETLETLQKEKQEREDSEKTELQKLQDNLTKREQELVGILKSNQEKEDAFKKVLTQRDAELLTSNILLTSGVAIDSYQRRGLVSEVVEKLASKEEGKTSEEVVESVVEGFLGQLKTIKGKDFKAVKIPGITPKGQEQTQDVAAKMRELLKDPGKNRAEILSLMKQLENAKT